jgi:hypothetical protein
MPAISYIVCLGSLLVFISLAVSFIAGGVISKIVEILIASIYYCNTFAFARLELR